uniref:Microtubule-associated protein 70-2 n=2 Tax=Anthurium amnicola TaxID=1678845 RepID=A0A1D1YSS7_9ARAE
MGDLKEMENDTAVDVGQLAWSEGKPPAGARKIRSRRVSLDEDDLLLLVHGSDPVKIELNRLENEVRDKDRELADAHGEIRALRLTERAKEKALDEVTEELEKMVEKLQISEVAVENKNLEIKRIAEEKKAALAAQFAAEATLRRVHAAQKDEELPPLEAILSPLEAEIKRLRQEVSKLQDDNRALERLTKSKEAALLDAEREVQIAKVKVAHVDDLQNKNQELMKQNEICQEEYKILDKMHRQKVAEVEKLGLTVRELEEALLSGAAAANAVRDYQRQVTELKEEKKTLERTLSRAKVTENRVAVVIANEWKDANDKVMPVKQWLEERRVLMGEMQQLRDKLSIAERAAKTEAQLKEKFQLRLKVVEDSLKSSVSQTSANGIRCNSVDGVETSPSSIPIKKSAPPFVRSASLSRHSAATLKHAKGVSRSFDGGSYGSNSQRDDADRQCMSRQVSIEKEATNSKSLDTAQAVGDDYVSSALYDILQKEVIALRKVCQERDQNLKGKDATIEVLSKKVDTLSKAIEVEAKKTRREKAAMEKEVASMRTEMEHEQRARRSRGMANHVHN